MRVLRYCDPETYQWYQEIIYKSYVKLEELKKAYEKKGHRTWMNPFDENNWVLTIVL